MSLGNPLRLVRVELLKSTVSRLVKESVKPSTSPPVFTPLRSSSRTYRLVKIGNIQKINKNTP